MVILALEVNEILQSIITAARSCRHTDVIHHHRKDCCFYLDRTLWRERPSLLLKCDTPYTSFTAPFYDTNSACNRIYYLLSYVTIVV